MPATFHQIMGVAAGIVSFVAFVPYTLAILKKETVPNRVTWFIWTINGWLALASYHEVGADTTIWLAISYAVFPALIFVLSIKWGEGGWTRFDHVCLATAIIGLILWWFTASALTGLICFLAADFAAALPTICKSWYRPQTEDRLAWMITAIGAVINLLAIDRLNIGVMVHPLYMLVMNCLIVVFIWRPKVSYNWRLRS